MNWPRLILTSFSALIVIKTIRAEDVNLLINELMQSNVDCIMDDKNDFPDSWVELYNPTESTINLQDYQLGITPLADNAWHLPAHQISPHGFALVYCDKVGEGLHAPFRLDSGKGGELYLFHGEDIADRIKGLDKQPAPNIAYGRETDGTDRWGYQAVPTPGFANCGLTCQAILGEPVFSQPGVVKTNGEIVSLLLSLPKDVPEETEIRYTIDGSEPTMTNGILYDGQPLRISTTRTIRAKLFCEGWLSPRSTTHSYIFHSRELTLPAISITTDERYLTDPQIGIYVYGAYDQEKPNYDYNWRRPANIELFESEGNESVLNQLGEMRVMGGASRKKPLKSLILYAHKRFGKKHFKFEFFPDQKPGLTKFKSLVLRNAGNDYDHLYMRDAVIQRSMAQNADLDWQAWSPAIIYINGQYKGILNIRERSTEDNIYTNYEGLEDIDMIENWKELKTGDWSHYDRFSEYIKEGSHTLEEYGELIDWREFINLMIMNLYFNNQDFPANNIVMWRPKSEDGRWRFVAKDTDFGLGIWNAPVYYNTIKWLYTPGYDMKRNSGNKPEATSLFRTMMENEDFRREFIDRASVYMGDFLNGHGVCTLWDSMYKKIEAELPHHLTLYNRSIKSYMNEMEDALAWVEERTMWFYQQIGDYYKLGSPVYLTINKDLAIDQPVVFNYNHVRLSSGSFDGCFYPNREIILTVEGRPVGETVTGWEICKTINGKTKTEIVAGSSLVMTMPFCDLLSINAIIGDHNGISEISDRRWACISSVGQLEVSGVAPGARISIYDMRGICVSKVTAVDQTVKISGISKGIYIVKVTIGKEELTEKVLVK